MATLGKDQGCTPIANLGPGNNSLENIGKAFDWLAGNVTCGDRVLIYICGHGYNTTCKRVPGGGVSLSDASGNEIDILRPKDPAADDGKDNTLADFLKKIPCCPEEDCDTRGECCNITVIIDSCFAGSFNVAGVTGECRTVIGSSNDTCSYGSYPVGLVYTQGFDKDSRDQASAGADGCVSPMEAHKTAKDAVDAYNRVEPITNQTPWISPGSNCTCKCPCKPSIGAEKWVLDWDGGSAEWVDEVEAQQGEPVYFRLEIENDGKCRDLSGLQVIDVLPSGLEYLPGSVTISYDEEQWPGEPEIIPGEMGTELVFNLEEIEALAPGETVAIVYKASAVELGPAINELSASAHCAVDPSKVVSDEDTATVTVVETEIAPPVVL